MSDRSSPCVFEDAAQSLYPMTEEEVGEIDSIIDDTCSSYYSAVCSLSDHDETPEGKIYTPCEGAASPLEVKTLAPVQQFETETISCPVSVQETDSKSAVLSAKHSQDLNNKIAVFSPPVQECDINTSVLVMPAQEINSKATRLATPEQEFDSNVTQAQDRKNTAPFSAIAQELDSNTAVSVPPTQVISCESLLTVTPVQEITRESPLLSAPTQDFDSNAAVHITPAHRIDSQSVLLPSTTQDFDSNAPVLLTPAHEIDIESILLPAPTQDFDSNATVHVTPALGIDSESIVLPAPAQNFHNNAAGHVPSAQEIISKTTLFPDPAEEISRQSAVLSASAQEFDRKTAVPLPPAQFDSKSPVLPGPIQDISSETLVLPAQNSSSISQVSSNLDISKKSFSVPYSCEPEETPLSLVSASQTSRLSHHVYPTPAITNETLKQMAQDSTIKTFQTSNVFLSKPSKSPRINSTSRDIVKVSMTTYADANTEAGFGFPPPQTNFNTILITPKGNQYNRDGAREIGGTVPTEAPLKQGPCLAEVASNHMTNRSRLHHWGQPMEESLSGVGEGQDTVARCGLEQAGLSIRDKNRKASVSCISTLTASALGSGIPPHCYSECILATGQQHQPQSPPDLWRWQKQSGQVAWRSRVLPQKLAGNSRKDFSATQQSSGQSNMGTKGSETHSEVKTLSNLPAKTFSCPDANYLDVYNLTCRSATQPYIENVFNGWTEDQLSFKLPMAFSQSNHNTSACSEASSVECIDVALETHEEVQRGSMKTVPKRQIQLKKKDTVELNGNENHDEPQEAPPAPSRPRDIFLRQHSTPAAFHQESHGPEQRSVQAERKQKLQKSLSLDETSSRTKMASCLIKNVLSKKMQHEQGFRSAEVQESAFGTVKAHTMNGHDNYQLLSAKEVSTEPITKISPRSSGPSQNTVSSQSPPLKAPIGSIKEHVSVNSKTQLKPPTKHSFNPLNCTLGWAEFQDDSPEITSVTDSQKAEKVSPRDEAARLVLQSPREELSCDSAKGKAWNTSAALSRATGSQACVKATPVECCAGKGNHKQQHIKSQPAGAAPKAWEKDVRKDKLSGNAEMPTSPQKISGLLSDLERSSDESNQALTPESPTVAGKELLIERGDLKVPGQFANVSTHDKLKGIAPVHVVRDVRSLVKNTYNLSFRGPGDVLQGLEESLSVLKPATPLCKRTGDKGNMFGSGDKQLGKRALGSPPVQVEKTRDINSQHNSPQGGLSKLDTGFTKVSPNSLSAASSCLESNAMEGMNSSGSLCKLDALSDNPKCKHTDKAERPPQALLEHSAELLTDGEVADHRQEPLDRGSGPPKELLQPQVVPLHSLAAASHCYPSAALLKESFPSPSVPPQSQGTPACVLTAALTPHAQVLPTYYYKPSPLSYPSMSPHVGAVSFVQGPMILQTSAQPMAPTGPSPLVKHVSDDGQQPPMNSVYTETRQRQKGSPKQTGNVETQAVIGEPKMSSPEAQPYLCGTQTLVSLLMSESRRGSAGTIYPELGGALISGGQAAPRHLLLDPETGRCFYVDVPPQPQRKMLFDPETCQYVEVLLPQQSVPSAVMSPLPSAMPVTFPAVYSPNCLPYLQSHAQVMPHPGP